MNLLESQFIKICENHRSKLENIICERIIRNPKMDSYTYMKSISNDSAGVSELVDQRSHQWETPKRYNLTFTKSREIEFVPNTRSYQLGQVCCGIGWLVFFVMSVISIQPPKGITNAGYILGYSISLIFALVGGILTFPTRSVKRSAEFSFQVDEATLEEWQKLDVAPQTLVQCDIAKLTYDRTSIPSFKVELISDV